MKLINKEDEIIEIVLNNNEVNELIKQLEKLKNSEEHIHFKIDNKYQLLIHHKEDNFLK